jgi:glycine betaine/proline transport system ATP-binding protein
LVESDELTLIEWDCETSRIEDVTTSTVVVASPDIGMRQAIELKQRSGQPILLVEDGKLVGVLNDSEFYDALLGNYNAPQAA